MASSSKRVEVPLIINTMQETGINTEVTEGLIASDHNYPDHDDDLIDMYDFNDVVPDDISLHLTLGGPYYQFPKELQLLPPSPAATAASGSGQLQLTLAGRPPSPDLQAKNMEMDKKRKDSGSSSAITSAINAADDVENNVPVLTPPVPAPTQPDAKVVASKPRSEGNVPRNCRSNIGPQSSDAAQENTLLLKMEVSTMTPVPEHWIPVPGSMLNPKETPTTNIGGSGQNSTVKVAPTPKRIKHDNYNMVEIGGETIKSMPTVYTIGDGIPNVRRIEGVLYKFIGSGVCIMCFCHGKFLTPAGFVKHAGGGDVDRPMKYIKVLKDNQ